MFNIRKMNFKKILLAVPVILLAGSCEDPEQEVFSQIDPSVINTTDDPTALQVLLAGAYTPLIGTWGGHNSLWSMYEVSSDEMAIAQKGADWEDGGQWIRMHRHEWLPTEESINNGWNYAFGALGTINNLIPGFSANPKTKGELEVLRALLYLWLIDAYGNVPIITEDTDDTTPPNNTRLEVYNFIESSILNNLENLNDSKTYGTINYYVAHAMLAKLYINAEVYKGSPEWQKAADAVDVIIDGGLYSLEPNFFDNFSTNNSGSNENILVIPYDQDNGRGFNLVQMTLHYSSQATFNLQEQPWNGYASLEDFYNSFDEDDRRINSFLAGPQFALDGSRLEDISAEATDPDGAPLTFTPEINELAPNSLRQAGVRVGKFEYQTGSGSNLSNDFPIFRYSDMLLIKAEALFRLGQTGGEALDLVNQVRARAGADDLPALTEDVLLAERGRELFAEGWRRNDLIRFGEFNSPWWEKPASQPFRNLFPIPKPVLDGNPDLVQNTGY